MTPVPEKLQQWVTNLPQFGDASLCLISGDASFRKYYRVFANHSQFIAVESPPDKEDNQQFLLVQQLLKRHGIPVPELLAKQLEQGFMLQQDLGDTLLLGELTPENADSHYGKAMDVLLKLQQIPAQTSLPLYDQDLLMREMMLFKDWLLGTHLHLQLNQQDTIALLENFQLLMDNALQQPQVVVHRDYHSRNLMLDTDGQIVTIDFQDAVMGPISYDLVSLLKDCYISWPQARVEAWVADYHQKLLQQGSVSCDFATFWRWFELMGVQRHLKAAGIFCRLYHRDGKSGYLADIPRTLNYVLDVASRYEELDPLAHIIDHKVLPRFSKG